MAGNEKCRGSVQRSRIQVGDRERKGGDGFSKGEKILGFSMAPKKRSAAQPEEDSAKPVESFSRVTRSSTRRVDNSNSVFANLPDELPKTKKAKTDPKEKENGKLTKKGKSVKAVEAEAAEAAEKEDSENVGEVTNKRIFVIEYCKQCRSFQTRAIQVKEGLEKEINGITVLMNPEKPRKGCFEIRDEGGVKFVSLLAMKRPFTPMKNLDMEKVISDIIEKIKG